MDHHDAKNFQTIDSLINLGDIVVDVGACHGTYTSFFARKLGATGRIYSIELMPNVFANLEMRFGHHQNIEFVNAAASDHVGMEDLFISGASEMNNITGAVGQKAGEIRSITLDYLLEQHEEISLIKIDVEGAEGKVLNGMTETMKKTKSLLIEVHFDEDWPEIRKILIEDNGFECYNIEKDEAVTMNSPRPYQLLCRRET